MGMRQVGPEPTGSPSAQDGSWLPPSPGGGLSAPGPGLGDASCHICQETWDRMTMGQGPHGTGSHVAGAPRGVSTGQGHDVHPELQALAVLVACL